MPIFLRGADGVRQSRQRFDNVLRALIREFLAFEKMIMDAEGQSFLRATLINSGEDVAGGIAAYILRSENLREAQRILEILTVFDGRTVIGNAANPGAIQLGSGCVEQIIAGMVHDHEFAP